MRHEPSHRAEVLDATALAPHPVIPSSLVARGESVWGRGRRSLLSSSFVPWDKEGPYFDCLCKGVRKNV